MVYNQVLETILNNRNGITAQWDGTIPSLSGFVVAVTDKKILGEEFTTDKLSSVLDELYTVSRNINHPSFVGSWQDSQTGDFFVDVTVNVPDLETARVLGRVFGQKAVFDITNLQEVRL